jgi:hypothetical protein
LGDDADTTAAIYGQLAGCLYGKAGIPANWLEKLHLAPLIESLALQLMPPSVTQEVDAEGDGYYSLAQCISIKKWYDWLEQQYKPILCKTNPGPKMYSSVSDFDADTEQFRSQFLQMTEEEAVRRLMGARDKLLQDFTARFVKSRTVIAQRSERPRCVFAFPVKKQT